MKPVIIGLLAVAIVVAWAPLGAQEPGRVDGGAPRLPPGKWWENPRLVERVQLTAEQQGKISELVYQHALSMVDLKAAVDKAELELADRVDRSEIDPARVRSAFAAFQAARAALQKERFEMLLAVRQLLSPQQWQELQRIHQELARRRAEQAAPRRTQRGGPAPGQPPR
jgi:Spy/CpxP family protein refolding chaperone